MSKFAPGIAASDAAIASNDASNIRKQQNVNLVAGGIGTIGALLGRYRQRAQDEANNAQSARILSQMLQSPAGKSIAPPDGQEGPAQQIPWSQAVGNEMANYQPTSALERLGGMFSQLGGSQPTGHLQPQAATSLAQFAMQREMSGGELAVKQQMAAADTANAQTNQVRAVADAKARVIEAKSQPMTNLVARQKNLGEERDRLLGTIGSNAALSGAWNQATPEQRMLFKVQPPLDDQTIQFHKNRINDIETEMGNNQKLLDPYFGTGAQRGGFAQPQGAPQAGAPAPVDPVEAFTRQYAQQKGWHLGAFTPDQVNEISGAYMGQGANAPGLTVNPQGQ